MLFLTEFLFHQMLFLRRICSSISWRCLQVHHYVWNRTDIFRILVFKLSVVCFNKYILAVFFFFKWALWIQFLDIPWLTGRKIHFFFPSDFNNNERVYTLRGQDRTVGTKNSYLKAKFTVRENGTFLLNSQTGSACAGWL